MALEAVGFLVDEGDELFGCVEVDGLNAYFNKFPPYCLVVSVSGCPRVGEPVILE